MRTLIFEDYYTPDQIGRMLLHASGSYREAKKILTKIHNEPKRRLPNDSANILMADARQKQLKRKKLGHSDHTALKKHMGDKYRSLYDKLKAKKLKLRRAAQLVQKPPKKL